MRSELILCLFMLGVLVPVTLGQGTCQRFTDTNGNCVQRCRYPEINDIASMKCLANDSACTTFFVQDSQQCVQQCPDNYQAVAATGKTYQQCIPCFFKDSKNQCYEVCPSPLISDITTKTCLDSSSQCVGYYLKAQEACLDQCPYQYSPVENQTPKLCVRCEVLGNCSDRNNNQENCTQKLSANKMKCGSNCPNFQYSKPAVSGQTYEQCYTCDVNQYINYDGDNCVSACDSTQVINYSTNSCIESLQCITAVIEDTTGASWCINKCPINYAQLAVDGQKYMHCVKCSNGQILDTTTNACVQVCPTPEIADATGQYCLKSLNDCQGFISSDNTKCLNSCAANEYIRQSDTFYNQFFCLTSCAADEFIFTITSQDNQPSQLVCVLNCPFNYYPDTTTKNCTSLSTCTKLISFDRRQCLDACPAGQFPKTNSYNRSQTICKPCTQKLSSDGKTCGADCAAQELFDLDQKQCIKQADCTGIINTTNITCQNKCGFNQIQSTDANNNKICINFGDCTKFVSSDRQSCVDACQDTEAPYTYEGIQFCVYCALGVSSDKQSCLKDCTTGQVLDIVNKKCIATADCSGMISVNGKWCVAACIYPEVKSSTNATQCQSQCATTEVYQDSVGCIASTSCQGYVATSLTANTQFCVDTCAVVFQIVDDTTSTPKTCKACATTEIPQVQGDSSILCVAKSADGTQNIQDEVDNIKKALQDKTTLSPAELNEVKNQIMLISQDVETQLISVKNNSALTSDNKKQLVQGYLSNLNDAVTELITREQTQAASTDTTQPSDNNLVLGSDEYQFIAEKKQDGFAFKIKFNLKDLLSSSQPSLQQDTTTVNGTDQTNPNIYTMSTTHLATNPYCTDVIACGGDLNGIFSVSTTTTATTTDTSSSTTTAAAASSSTTATSTSTTTIAGGSGRILTAAAATTTASGLQTYQMTYDVSAAKINQTICVAYDQTSGAMSLLDTSYDRVNNQITCTFTVNSSLYYDSTCQYIDTSICTTDSSVSNTISSAAAVITHSSILISKLAVTIAIIINFIL